MAFTPSENLKPIFLPYQILHNFSDHSFSFMNEAAKYLPIEAYIGTILNIYGDTSLSFASEAERTFFTFSRLFSLPLNYRASFYETEEKSRAKTTTVSQGTWCSFNEWSFSSYVFCNINFCLTSLSSSLSVAAGRMSRLNIAKGRKIIKNFVKTKENKISVFLYVLGAVNVKKSYDSIYVSFYSSSIFYIK